MTKRIKKERLLGRKIMPQKLRASVIAHPLYY
jgi:hypothetical protein